MVGISKDNNMNVAGVKNNITNYPVAASLSPLKHTSVPKAIPDSQNITPRYNNPDRGRKLNNLINAYDVYRQSFNDLLGVSPNLLRAIEGLYPDYGQYENVPNSGWSHYTPVSLHQQNALSIPDKIAYGTKIYNMSPTSILMDEKGADELSKLHEQDGGIKHNNADRYTKKFNKALLAQLKSYVDLDNMATKTDDISRLAYTRLKSYFDIMEILIDDEKLQEFTGVSLNVDKEKDLFITKRLLPDPLDAAQKGKPLTLWSEEEKKVGDALKTSPNFEFLKNYLLDTPTTLISDKNSIYNQSPASFMNPYESLSDTTKNMLNVRRDHIEDYTATLPPEQAKEIRNIFFDNKILGKYSPPTATNDGISVTKGVLPPAYQSVSSDFFRKQKEKFDNPITEFQKKSKDILEKMNIRDSFYVRTETGQF